MMEGDVRSKGRDDGAAQSAAEEEMRGEKVVAVARVRLGDRWIFNLWVEFRGDFFTFLNYFSSF